MRIGKISGMSIGTIIGASVGIGLPSRTPLWVEIIITLLIVIAVFGTIKCWKESESDDKSR